MCIDFPYSKLAIKLVNIRNSAISWIRVFIKGLPAPPPTHKISPDVLPWQKTCRKLANRLDKTNFAHLKTTRYAEIK